MRYTKFGVDQVEGPQDIERTTFSYLRSNMTLSFDFVTSQSIGVIYFRLMSI